MRAIVIASILLAGCGGTYDTQCDGPGGIDCELVGLSVCTKSYGSVAPHAFCTQPCATDDDCGTDGICVDWRFPRSIHRVCVAPSWVN